MMMIAMTTIRGSTSEKIVGDIPSGLGFNDLGNRIDFGGRSCHNCMDDQQELAYQYYSK